MCGAPGSAASDSTERLKKRDGVVCRVDALTGAPGAPGAPGAYHECEVRQNGEESKNPSRDVTGFVLSGFRMDARLWE